MSHANRNRQWLVAANPLGRPLQDDDFTLAAAPMPAPAEGEILVQTQMLGFDPAQKGWMENVSNYVAPLLVGDVMRGATGGVVVESRAADFAPGDRVTGLWGWQEFAALKAVPDPLTLHKLPPDCPLSTALSLLGLTGLTAYFGLLEIGRPKAGDMVVVSGAAGATGSVVGQLAKLSGCQVVGIAGGAEKCDWLVRECGFDAAIDYKSEKIGQRLKLLCPNGIDVVYDNVGGSVLNAMLGGLAQRARVVICGGISRYQTGDLPEGPRNYFNLIFARAQMEGFIVLDYAPRFAEARARLWQWLESGRLRTKEDIRTGFEAAPQTLMRLFTGQNFGKQLLRL